MTEYGEICGIYKENVRKPKNTGSDAIIWDYYNKINEYFRSEDNAKNKHFKGSHIYIK